MESLTGKIAVVTGSSRGIGARLAKVLSQAGASVIVNYAGSKSAADKIVDEIESNGGRALALKADVSKAAEVKSMFDSAISAFGKIDILVNNAGIIFYKKLQDTTDEDFDRIFAINVKGTFNTLREAATRIEDGGRIVNLSSSVTRLMLPFYGAYSATKGAVEQLTRVFAKEVGPRRITVNSVSPGPTNTALFSEGKTEDDIKRLASMAALGRIGEPEDIASAVLFLVSDAAAWVTGQNLGVNGGFA